ncbi:metalloendoproteinase 2-MMP-like [Sesamum indicum]|uniref:Metalloendoproteinase 2-MMP-like n=1 Tax=Sesamum indicum TaxID=4182 RepID=A0A6I9TWT4_SESIN|nr:metalloendoproteinase 2-MMP-like [Sesamum indicum]
MALKPLHCFSLVFHLFVTLSSVANAKRQMPSDQKPSPFDFIKHLEGCHKGNKTKDIHHLKHYLHQFGYLDYPNQIHANNNDFDDLLESALKEYQRYYNINPTGAVDAETIAKMVIPRCGNRDIVHGTNTMLPRPNKKENSNSSTNSIHTVSQYSFFPGNLRWSKTHLTYGFSPNTPTATIDPVIRAFAKWDSATHFTFSRAQNNQRPDLIIGFHRRDHGDGSPFDGPGGTIAHAFAPSDGRFHYDSDEAWSMSPVGNAFHLETVALHEIGHLLGLGHSSVADAIMYPSISRGATKNLHADDIQGIKALYNV